MRGLVLEGGGARGAYHIGVVKAYLERGVVFDGFVGTSIGAINAAILAQGDFEKALELWQNISLEQLFELDEKLLITFRESKLDWELTASLPKVIKKVITGGGFDTKKMKEFLNTYIDESKIRASGKDFGLVTFSLDERKVVEVLLKDIPHGKLVNYIMASASLPGFKSEIIDEKKFLDGGFFNNCPVNLLVDKDYDEIIVVRTGAPGIFKKVESDAKVRIISTDDDLGEMLSFTKERSEVNILLGYHDGLRSIDQLRGWYYYLQPIRPGRIHRKLLNMDPEAVYEIGKILDLPKIPPQRLLFEAIIPTLATVLNLKKDYDYVDFWVGLLEHRAIEKEIDRFRVYTYDEFFASIQKAPHRPKEETLLESVLSRNFPNKKVQATEKFINHIIS